MTYEERIDFNEKARIIEKLNTHEEVLILLSNDKNYKVRDLVAQHKNTPLYILEKLSNDKNSEVRNSVTENKNVSKSIFIKLTEDKDYYVRLRSMYNNKHISVDIINNILAINNFEDNFQNNEIKHVAEIKLKMLKK